MGKIAWVGLCMVAAISVSTVAHAHFVSPDPVPPKPGNVFGFNRYAYANDNPVNNVDPTGAKVAFGPGASSEGYKFEYAMAKLYLVGNGVGSVLTAVEKSERVVTLLPGTFRRPDTEILYKGGKIVVYWSPLQGIKIGTGVISPAVALLHEFGHALGDINGKSESNKYTNSRWTNAEEKRVILNVEDPAEKRLDEPVRDSHGGTFVPVSCSVCRKVPNFSKRDLQRFSL